jgi:hypothetical protein
VSILAVLVVVVLTLSSIDRASSGNIDPAVTTLKVTVVDINDNVVHNAKITVVGGTSFFSDNKGMSPAIVVPNCANWYDSGIDEWFCVNVTVSKEGFVDTIVVGCVMYTGNLRSLTVRLFKADGSDLPYVCYVESPPDSYMQGVFGK